MPKDEPTIVDAFWNWRRDRVTVTQVESTPILDHEMPFTDAFAGWKRFKEGVLPGDELWTFSSPQETWERHMGWQGLLLMRGDRFQDFLITAQN